MKKILLAGEQVTSIGFEIKGFDHFSTSNYNKDGNKLFQALKKNNEVDWIKTSHISRCFPESINELNNYDVVILSDVGSNTLLLHPEVLEKSIRRENRCKIIHDYVADGGGLLMVGGWMSFSGIEGKAKYYDSLIEECLPVNCLKYDDRQERPEGMCPVISIKNSHAILKEMPVEWPFFLGYNKVLLKDDATKLLEFENEDPLLTIWNYKKGRSAAFTSDCAPHWGTSEFLNWKGYNIFWNNLVNWLSG